VLRAGSLRSIMLRLTISGSMYLDYSKRHWRLALRRNNAANGRVEARMLAGSSLQWFGRTDQGEDGEITGPCTMRTSSIDVPSISRSPPSKSSLDAGVKYSCKGIYVSSISPRHFLCWMVVCRDQCCVSPSIKDRAGTLSFPLPVSFISRLFTFLSPPRPKP
jgi:hypothetical protein